MRPRDSARLGVSVGQIEELLAVRVGVHGERWQGKAWGIGGRLELGADSEIFGNTSQILGASPFIFVGAKQGVLQVYAGVGPGFELVVPESQVSQLDALAEVHGNLSVHLWHLAFALGATVQFSARGRHGGLVTPSIGGSF